MRWFLVLFIVVSLVACGGGGDDNDDDVPTATTDGQASQSTNTASDTGTTAADLDRPTNTTAPSDPTVTSAPAGQEPAPLLIGDAEWAGRASFGASSLSVVVPVTNPNTAAWVAESRYSLMLLGDGDSMLTVQQGTLSIPPDATEWVAEYQVPIDPELVTRVELLIEPEWRDDEYPISGLEITRHNLGADGTSVVGVLHNGSALTLGQAQITTMLRDADGTFLSGGVEYLNDVSPGSDRPFETNYYGDREADAAAVATYDVFVRPLIVPELRATTAPIQPTATAASEPIATPTPLSDSDRDLAESLLTLDDMPTGWSITPDTSDDDSDEDSNQICDAEPISSQIEAEASAEREFSAGELGPFVTQLLAVMDEDAAKLGMEHIRSSFGCGTWTDDDATVWTLAEISFPSLGDETLAYRMSATSGFFVINGNVIVVRDGGTVMMVLHLVVGDIDSEFTEEITRKAFDKAMD